MTDTFFSIKRWREKRPLEDEARAHIEQIFTTVDIDDKIECKNLRELQIEVEVFNINLIAHKLQKLSKDMLIEMWLQYLLLFADRKISELEEK